MVVIDRDHWVGFTVIRTGGDSNDERMLLTEMLRNIILSDFKE